MLRAVIGFDHIAKNVQNSWLANCGYPLTRSADANGKPLIINDAAALTTISGTHATLQTQAVFDFTSYLPTSGFTVVTVGVRIKVEEGTANGKVAYIGSVVGGSDATWVYSWGVAGQSPPGNVGNESYVEFEINTATQVVSVYVDGVYFAQAALSTAVAAAIKTGKLCMFFPVSFSAAPYVISLKDIYLLDNMAGDGFTKRLGSRRSALIVPDAAVGAGWTTTDSSPLLTPLLVSPEVANPATLVAPVNKTPLKLSLKGNAPVGGTIEAIMLMVSGKTDINGVVTKVRVEDGAAVGADKALANDFTTTLKYGLPAGIYPKHPSGAAWTNANLDTTNLVLSPDTVG